MNLYRVFETRKMEHEAKFRLIENDVEEGKNESAVIRMDKEDGGITRERFRRNQK